MDNIRCTPILHLTIFSIHINFIPMFDPLYQTLIHVAHTLIRAQQKHLQPQELSALPVVPMEDLIESLEF